MKLSLYLIIKTISGYYITLADIQVEPSWIEFLQDNTRAEIIIPPILCLKFNLTKIVLDEGSLELVNDYSNKFIEFLIKNK